jgi:hypothetical protein
MTTFVWTVNSLSTLPMVDGQTDVVVIAMYTVTASETSIVVFTYNMQRFTYTGSAFTPFDQLTEAFSLGAEWCSYGWSAGGMALYPTQSSTWSKLQDESQESKRTACGHPGVNGGYFDPKLKFGVNCYGVKPKNRGMKFPQPLPTQDPGFDSMVQKFKKMGMKLAGFNRDIWSETGLAKQAEKNASTTAASLETDVESIPTTLYNAL